MLCVASTAKEAPPNESPDPVRLLWTRGFPNKEEWIELLGGSVSCNVDGIFSQDDFATEVIWVCSYAPIPSIHPRLYIKNNKQNYFFSRLVVKGFHVYISLNRILGTPA